MEQFRKMILRFLTQSCYLEGGADKTDQVCLLNVGFKRHKKSFWLFLGRMRFNRGKKI